MKFDWHRKADAERVGESASVLRRSRRGGGLESTFEATGTDDAGGASGAGASERERLDRLGEALATSHPAVPEGEQDEIKDEVLAGARSGLAKVNQGEPPQNFTLGEHIGLEAVILTNGERPSLFVRNGFVDLNAPDIGDWDLGLLHFQHAIRKVIASVGRIDVPVRPWFAGTCFVVAEGLVLTNRHVLEEIASQDGAGTWTLNWPDATSVDFVGEDGAAAATKFKVTGVAFAGPDPINRNINFAHLDMAILRVDPASDAGNSFPIPVTFEIDSEQPKARRDLYVVGFPGEPRIWTFDGTPPTGHETTQVISTLFNNKFGVKRLAPGCVKAGVGEVANDSKKWICTHDASTLGGNSGSCIVDLSADGSRIMALHFAGANREQNWAHVAARLHDQLSVFSAKFVSYSSAAMIAPIPEDTIKAIPESHGSGVTRSVDSAGFDRIEPLLLGPNVLGMLRRQPSLLREIAAEFGAKRRDILAEALRTFGPELREFLVRTPSGDIHLEPLGFKNLADADKALGPELGAYIGQYIRGNDQVPQELINLCVDVLRKAVDRSLLRASR